MNGLDAAARKRDLLYVTIAYMNRGMVLVVYAETMKTHINCTGR